MSEASEQCPAPKFKVGQVVGYADLKAGALKINSVRWSHVVNDWLYSFNVGGFCRGSWLRPLSIDEIGSDELSKLAEMLEGADSRRADMERERDEARAKLATSRDLCEKLIYAADILSHDCEKGANSGDWGNWSSGDWKELVDMRAVIAEAEAAQEGK